MKERYGSIFIDTGAITDRAIYYFRLHFENLKKNKFGF